VPNLFISSGQQNQAKAKNAIIYVTQLGSHLYFFILYIFIIVKIVFAIQLAKFFLIFRHSGLAKETKVRIQI